MLVGCSEKNHSSAVSDSTSSQSQSVRNSESASADLCFVSGGKVCYVVQISLTPIPE